MTSGSSGELLSVAPQKKSSDLHAASNAGSRLAKTPAAFPA
jgi:hypothetical protein